MARPRYVFDQARNQRFMAHGGGAGRGSVWRPWSRIQDAPSGARPRHAFDVKTRRKHQSLSDIEWKCFLMFESDTAVMDIREQFPTKFDRKGGA